MKNFLRKIFGLDSKIILYLTLIKRATLSTYLINFVFQRIFRKNSHFSHNVNFTSVIIGENIKINKDLTTLLSFCVSSHCYFQSINGIKVGKNFLFAPGVKIISSNHDFTELRKSVATKPIEIGDNCWLGANVILLPGIKIGNNCVVGAGSVVTKNFEEDNLILAGNPARIIRRLNK